MFTIVASRTTISWARPTTPRISQRRGTGGLSAVPEAACPLPSGMLVADIAHPYLEG
jgi:hypothetical protein